MLWIVFQPTVGHYGRTMSENSYVTFFFTVCSGEAGVHDTKFSYHSWTFSLKSWVLLWCQMAGWCVLHNLDKCSLFKCKLGECVDGELICFICRWWQPSGLICNVFSKWKIHSSCDTGQVSEHPPSYSFHSVQFLRPYSFWKNCQ